MTEQARPTGWLGRVAELWLNLMGVQLQVAAVLLAAAAPVLVAWWWRRKTMSGSPSALRPLAAVLVCQLLAISALFLWVHNQYGFYTSWSDLMGRRTEQATIHSNGLVRPGDGRLEVLTVTRPPRAEPIPTVGVLRSDVIRALNGIHRVLRSRGSSTCGVRHGEPV